MESAWRSEWVMAHYNSSLVDVLTTALQTPLSTSAGLTEAEHPGNRKTEHKEGKRRNKEAQTQDMNW